MKFQNKITQEQFNKMLSYSKKNHIDSITAFLEENKTKLIAKEKKIKDLINPQFLYKTHCDCFLSAVYALIHGQYSPMGTIFTEEAKFFDMKKIIVGNATINEEWSFEKMGFIMDKYFNYKYIQNVIDQIAQNYHYEMVTDMQLKSRQFSLEDLDQIIIGLKEEKGKIMYYEVMNLKELREFPKYYIRKSSFNYDFSREESERLSRELERLEL